MAITVREQLGGNTWVPPQIPNGWQPERCPDLTAEPWQGVNVPWRTPVFDAVIDTERTAALPSVDVPVDIHATGPVWDGSVAGMPFQLLDASTKTQRVAVIDQGRPAEWRWSWSWPFLTVVPATTTVDLPAVVRREGDPSGAWDRHVYLLDNLRGNLIEMILVDSQPQWRAGYDGGGPGISVWDTTKPWNAPGQPAGVVAGAFPHMPHFIRVDEIERGKISHAAFMALPNYANGKTGYARGFDGSDAKHPLRAGERLRLPKFKVERYPVGSWERIVAEGLATFGVTVGDRTMHGQPSTAGPGVIPGTQDPRWAGNWKGLNLRLSDFEVVHF